MSAGRAKSKKMASERGSEALLPGLCSEVTISYESAFGNTTKVLYPDASVAGAATNPEHVLLRSVFLLVVARACSGAVLLPYHQRNDFLANLPVSSGRGHCAPCGPVPRRDPHQWRANCG